MIWCRSLKKCDNAVGSTKKLLKTDAEDKVMGAIAL